MSSSPTLGMEPTLKKKKKKEEETQDLSISLRVPRKGM